MTASSLSCFTQPQNSGFTPALPRHTSPALALLKSQPFPLISLSKGNSPVSKYALGPSDDTPAPSSCAATSAPGPADAFLARASDAFCLPRSWAASTPPASLTLLDPQSIPMQFQLQLPFMLTWFTAAIADKEVARFCFCFYGEHILFNMPSIMCLARSFYLTIIKTDWICTQSIFPDAQQFTKLFWSWYVFTSML